MKAGGRRPRLSFAAALALASALAPAAHGAVRVQTQQTEPPRRPQGPVAGPIIKLPPGSGAVEERTQASGAKEETARAASLPQRWEYCVIRGFTYRPTGLSLSSPHKPSALVRYLPEGSEEIEGSNEEEALGNAFAKLGEEGWELAGIRTDLSIKEGDGKSSTIYFFKRPKRQD